MEHISLMEFVKTINVSGTRYYRTRKEYIVIVYPSIDINDESKSEAFYKQQCALLIPFRQSLLAFYDQLLPNKDETFPLLNVII